MGLSDEVGLKRTILVVDDEPLARLTTADMLRLGDSMSSKREAEHRRSNFSLMDITSLPW